MSKKTLTNESLSFRHICETKFGANLETGHYEFELHGGTYAVTKANMASL